jgi:hypothetical protein
MKIRLLLDEDAMSRSLASALRSKGVEVTTVGAERREEYSDEEQLVYAAEHGLVIYTFNRKDFMALHTNFLEQGISHAGIILAPEHGRYSIGEQLRRLLLIIEARSAEELKDQAIFLSNGG